VHVCIVHFLVYKAMSVYHHSVKAVRIASYVWRLHGLCSCCTPATAILCLFRNSRYDCTRSLRPYSVQAAQGNVSLPLARLVKSLAHVLCMGAGVFEKGKKEKEKGGVFV
jgi:hypothetical protein